MTPQEIISDDEIVRVHGNANFGAMDPREVVNDGVRKTAVGYYCGSTQLHILRDHGLVTKPRPGSSDTDLTKKGKAYARSIYRDTTPARAEAQDEGAAGEPVAWRIRRNKGDAGFGRPQVFTTDEATDGDLWQWRRNGYDVQPLYAHPSPTPAADADRVRIAVEAFNAKINAPLTGPTHGAWDRGRIAGLKEALAALKSTAAKEGEGS